MEAVRRVAAGMTARSAPGWKAVAAPAMLCLAIAFAPWAAAQEISPLPPVEPANPLPVAHEHAGHGGEDLTHQTAAAAALKSTAAPTSASDAPTVTVATLRPSRRRRRTSTRRSPSRGPAPPTRCGHTRC